MLRARVFASGCLALAMQLRGVALCQEREVAWGGVVAMVGDQRIAEADLTLRRTVIEIRGGEATRAAALVEMLGETLEKEVARQGGLEPDEEELLALERHAHATTQAPQKLATLQTLFLAEPQPASAPCVRASRPVHQASAGFPGSGHREAVFR
jgi:hypothetical protein